MSRRRLADVKDLQHVVCVFGLLGAGCGSPSRSYDNASAANIGNSSQSGDAGAHADGDDPAPSLTGGNASDHTEPRPTSDTCERSCGEEDGNTSGEASGNDGETHHDTSTQPESASTNAETNQTPEDSTTTGDAVTDVPGTETTEGEQTTPAVASTDDTTTSTSASETGDTTSSEALELSSCTNTDYPSQGLNNEYTAFPAARGIYVFGDNVTTACTDDTKPGTLCVEGNATAAGEDYANWGVGVGLQLAPVDDQGVTLAPWNAAELGIVALRFTLTNVQGRPVQVQIAQTDDARITDQQYNYQFNPFIWGGSTPRALPEGVTTLELTQFRLPSWGQEKIETGLGGAIASTILDGSKLHSVMFQAASATDDPTQKYSFCLSEVAWLDAAGFPVAGL